VSKIDLNIYKDFVQEVTSSQSSNLEALIERLRELEECGVNVALLLTSSIGIASEGGEFSEIVKKCAFQGKPLTDDVKFHIMRELGDIAWYWINACRAMNVDPNDVIAENVKKLESRYPGGKFDILCSENRNPDDL
jgi:NTP pyrophosphatase (non-canonical NTP hydrolase)